MSKSLGNTYTISDLRDKGFNPLAFRYMCLNAHYRNKLNFTWDVMQASQVSYDRFIEGALQHRDGTAEIPKDVLNSFLADFEDSINDDLNIPKALGIAWNMVRYSEKSKDIYELLLKMDTIFGLGIKDSEKKSEEIPELDAEVERLIEQRQQARKDKNWKLSDEIRDKLKDMGIELQDTPQGVKWSVKK